MHSDNFELVLMHFDTALLAYSIILKTNINYLFESLRIIDKSTINLYVYLKRIIEEYKKNIHINAQHKHIHNMKNNILTVIELLKKYNE